MPKSKRERKITLSKTKKKGSVQKDHLIAQVRESLEKFSDIYVFAIHNMRSAKLKNVRKELPDSRFFFGKNRVMSIALGKTKDDELKENTHLLSEHLTGKSGLLFTNSPKEEVFKTINSYREKEYPQSGYVPLETITVEKGPLTQFSHAIEPHLRKLGLTTSLEDGVIKLLKDFNLCTIGEPITPEQSKLLKLFGHEISDFYLVLICRWFENNVEVF